MLLNDPNVSLVNEVAVLQKRSFSSTPFMGFLNRIVSQRNDDLHGLRVPLVSAIPSMHQVGRKERIHYALFGKDAWREAVKTAH